MASGLIIRKPALEKYAKLYSVAFLFVVRAIRSSGEPSTLTVVLLYAQRCAALT